METHLETSLRYVEEWLTQFVEVLDNPRMMDRYRQLVERATKLLK